MSAKEKTGYPSIDKPWLKYYSEAQINTQIPNKTIWEMVYENNKEYPSQVALNYYGKNISYGKLFDEVSLISGALKKLGIKENDVVTICMMNAPETIYLFLALNKIGAVANMVYVSSTDEELKKYITEAKSSIVFTLDLFQDKFVSIADEVHLKKIVVASLTQSMSFLNRLGAKYIKGMKSKPLPRDDRFLSWNTFCKEKRKCDFVNHNSEAPAVITYTGGTTGGSKGAVLSSRAIVSVAYQYITMEPDISRSHTWVQVLPLFIAYGVACSLMIPLLAGMTLIVRLPMSDSIADLCKKFKPNHIIYGPAYWEAFADDNVDLDLSYFATPITGGDTIRPAVEEKINNYLKTHNSPYLLMNGYGMTEVGAAVSVNFRHAYEAGSVGTPFIHNTISAFDPETEEELPYGKEGEICICTPSMMSGYVNNPEETSNVIRKHKDGLLWVHSGDLGYISENGFVHISGRLKRYMLCIAGGIQKKVYSLDIEKELLKHPMVEQCAVVPVDDKILNQVPVAFVISKKSAEKSDSKKIENELQELCEANLQPVYRPTRYIFKDVFPLTKVGKVDYHALEEEAGNMKKVFTE